ncbi:EAL domain-containing protein [Cyanobacterium aponinum]|uniref:EAL domain-containing protein n=1 Tax=Cyanobacterium aponinum 0216 TaxID=2676140 RepID=A0A844GLI6_9CHRO|nr:EAL domain-containing protein [Cyanobacterium aponinum]MTF37424.1 EAL domain-containing protein [Cyanobacterium aponinum 0216]
MKINQNYIKHILAVECGSWKKTFFLDKDNYSIGRNSTNTFFCHHRVISRNHAHIIRVNYQSLVDSERSHNIFWLMDGDFFGRKSTNGIYVNGKKCFCAKLNPGDIIFFGGIDVKAKYDIVNLQSKTFFSIAFPEYKSIFEEEIKESDISDLSIFSTFTDENFSILELISQGVFIVNLESSEIVKVNQNYCEMLGYSTSEIIGLKLQDLDCCEKEIIKQDLSILAKNTVKSCRYSIHKGKNKKLINVLVKSVPINYQEQKCILVSVENNSNLQKLEDALRYQSSHDLSTNLGNKNLLEKQLAWSLGFNSLKESNIALIKIKINQWENISNYFSQETVSKLLENFILIIKKSLSSIDCLCQISANEYIILKEEVINESQVNTFIEQILNDLRQPIVINGNSIILNINFGVAIHPQDGQNLHELIKNTNITLESSYDYGSSNYLFFTENIAKSITIKNKNIMLMSNVISNNRFILKYYPIISTKTEILKGFNATISLLEENKELQELDILLKVKESNYDQDLLLWSLEQILKDYNSWMKDRQTFDIKIGLKVLLSTLMKDNVIDKVSELIAPENQFPCIELEIVLDNSIVEENLVLERLNILSNSSLNYGLFSPDIQTFFAFMREKIKVNTLKTSPRLIKNLEGNSGEEKLISCGVDLAQFLNVNLVIEGVSTENQKDILSSIGCDGMQGLFFSPALESEKVPYFLEKSRVE